MIQQNNGFSLIEMLVAMAIFAMVVSVAIPSYNSSVVKSGRSDAKISLMSMSQLMEQCFTQTDRYDHVQCTSLVGTGIDSKEGLYKISFITGQPTSTTYTLQAIPVVGKQQASDTQCVKLSLNSVGQKTAIDSSSTDSSKICW